MPTNDQQYACTSRSSSSKIQAQRYAELTSAKIANDVIDSNRYGWQLTEEESDAKLRADLIANKEAASMRSNVLFSNCFDNLDDEMEIRQNQIVPPTRLQTQTNVYPPHLSNEAGAYSYTVTEYTTNEYVIASEFTSAYKIVADTHC